MTVSLPTFHLAAKSGLIAATTAADSVLFAWHNASPTVTQFLHRIEVKARVITGYTAEFENALELRGVTLFGTPEADYTGGTDLSHPTTAANKAYRRISVDKSLKPAQESSLASGNVRIATTGGLSHAGTPTINSHPFAYEAVGELVAGAAVAKGFYDLVWEPPVVRGEVVPRAVNPTNGFVLRNPVTLAATGTLRIWVSVLWSEQS